MSSSSTWKFSYIPEDGSRRTRESNKRLSEKRETSSRKSDKPDWPFGYSSKPHINKEDYVASNGSNRGATPSKKEDWEIQAITAAASRRSGAVRETLNSPTASRHGEHGVGEKRDLRYGRSTEGVIRGTYPHETPSVPQKDSDFEKASGDKTSFTPSESTYPPDISDSSSWHNPPIEGNLVHTSHSNVDHNATNSRHSGEISHGKQHHSSKASSKASSTKSSTLYQSHTAPRHGSPPHLPSPKANRPSTGSIPLDLALRDMHHTLTSAYSLFTSYESAYDGIAGHIVNIAEDHILDSMWQQMVRDQFSREPDRREFDAARDGLKSRSDAVESAVDGGAGGGYDFERRQRAARKVVAHMNEIMSLVSRARKERMGCKFLVEEVSELVSMLDPKDHEMLYSDGEERRWIGSVKAAGAKEVAMEAEDKKGNKKGGGSAHSGGRTSSKERSGKNDGNTESQKAAGEGDEPGKKQQGYFCPGEEQKNQEDSTSWGGDEQPDRDKDQQGSGSQKGDSGDGDGTYEHLKDAEGRSESKKGDGDENVEWDNPASNKW